MIEKLERRCLLASSVSNGVLSVIGTSSNDIITVKISGSNITLADNGITKTFATSTITAIKIDGKAGNDSLALNDSVVKPATLIGGDGNDTLRGGGKNDSLSGGNQNDRLDGGAGADTFAGGSGSDIADYSGRIAAIIVNVNGTADDGAPKEKDNVQTDIESIIGGSGNDLLIGSGGNNFLDGRNGNDTLRGMGGDDALFGTAGNDLLDGGIGSDYLDGGSGSDIADYSTRTNGVKVDLDGALKDNGEPGEADSITATVETVIGGPGNDTLVGNSNNNLLDGAGGNNTLSGVGGDDTLAAGSGRDTFLGGSGTDIVDYTSHSQTVIVNLNGLADDGATGENDSVGADIEGARGGAGADRLIGNDGENALYGGGGNDTITGNGGNDTCSGEAGDDSLDGGLGADLIQGGTGIDAADYSSRTEDLDISLDGQPNDGGYSNEDQTFVSLENDNVAANIDVIFTGSGSDTIDASQFRNPDHFPPTAAHAMRIFSADGNDKIFTSNGGGDDFIDAGGGDDDIRTFAGRDTISGGDGDDEIEGGGDSNSIDGGDGRDFISAGDGNNTIIGGNGNDEISAGSGDDVVDGGDGDDRIFGSEGADLLRGGPGNDNLVAGVVLFFMGEDNVPVTADDNAPDTLDGGSGADNLHGDPDDTADYSSRTNPILVSIGDTNSADGEVGEGDDVTCGVVLAGSGDDTLVGDDNPNRLVGNGGNDSLDGGKGIDTLDGGTGADIMKGGADSDTADYSSRSAPVSLAIDGIANDGAAGEKDSLGDDIEILIGGSASDTLAGSAVNNTLKGNGGADVMKGGGGVDTVDYSDRTAPLTVDLDGVADDGAAGEGDNAGADCEIILGGSGNDRLTGNASDNTIRGGLGADTVSGLGGSDCAEYMERTTGVSAHLDGLPDSGASGEKDVINTDIETLVGGAGNDTLVGDSSNNALLGLGGNDRLDGGLGTDALIGGPDTDIADYSSRTSAVIITLDAFGNDGQSGEKDFVSPDVEILYGSKGKDKLTGNASNNTLRGGGGADTLSGGGGIDAADYGDKTTKVVADLDGVADDGTLGEKDQIKTDIENLIGGSAGDSLTGNSGNNTLRGGGGADTLSGGTGFDAADYSDKSSAVTANLDGVANDGTSGEKDLIKTDIEMLIGGKGNDKLNGSSHNETLNGGAGNDTLNPGLGSDILIGGDGTDTADYSARTDSLVFSGWGGSNQYPDGANVAVASPGPPDPLDASATIDGDSVSLDVENVKLGSGNDVIGAGGDFGRYNDDPPPGTNTFHFIDTGAGNDLALRDGGLQGPGINYNLGDGDDHLTIGDSGATVNGGNGNDTVTLIDVAGVKFDGGPGIDEIDDFAQDFNDDQTLDLRDSISVENASKTDGLLIGTDGPNRLSMISGSIQGLGGDDLISGFADAFDGVGTFDGGEGNDTVSGGGGIFEGGPGDDLLMSDGNGVTLIGGPGADRFRSDGSLFGDPVVVSYADSPTGIIATFDGLANDGVAGEHDNIGAGIDAIIGTKFNDTFVGDNGDQTFYPGLGTDDVHGGDGTDSVNYSDRTANLNFTGDDVANDGAAGEHDNIHNDVENVTGGSGNDKFVGGDSDNVFVGGLGADDFIGGGGNDLVDYEPNQNVGDPGLNVSIDDIANDGQPGEGDNVHTDIESVRGGPNADTLSAGAAASPILPNIAPLIAPLETAGVSLIGGGGGDLLIGGPQDDYLDGTDYSGIGTTMIGNAGNDVFVNQDTTSDTIDGGEGLDEAQEESFDSFTDVEFFYDLQDASPGAPLMASALAAAAPLVAGVQVTDGVVFITGTDGNDSILVSQSVTGLTISINGAAQSVLVAGIRGINIIAGGGNDNVDLMNNPSKPVNLQTTIKGGDGNDTLNGGTNADAILGGRGNDRCIGNAGGDILNGGDKGLTTNDGTDVLIGGADGADGSRDAVDYASRTDDLKLTLDGVANDGAIGENDSIDVENIFSGKGNDLIRGDAKQNVLTGGLGKDTIFGGDNIDKIVANAKGENQQYDTSGKPLPVDSVFGEGGNDFLELRDNTGDAFSGGKGITTRQIDPNSLDISVLA